MGNDNSTTSDGKKYQLAQIKEPLTNQEVEKLSHTNQNNPKPNSRFSDSDLEMYYSSVISEINSLKKVVSDLAVKYEEEKKTDSEYMHTYIDGIRYQLATDSYMMSKIKDQTDSSCRKIMNFDDKIKMIVSQCSSNEQQINDLKRKNDTNMTNIIDVNKLRSDISTHEQQIYEINKRLDTLKNNVNNHILTPPEITFPQQTTNINTI